MRIPIIFHKKKTKKKPLKKPNLVKILLFGLKGTTLEGGYLIRFNGTLLGLGKNARACSELGTL